MYMKKIILIIALVFALFRVNAQTQYDTLVYHPYDLSECYWGNMNFIYYEYYAHLCDSCNTSYYPGTNIPCFGSQQIAGMNIYDVQGLAQPYHFDSTVTVIGIAVKLHNPNGCLSPSLYGNVFLRIMDMGFNDLDSSIIDPWNTSLSDGYRLHYFHNEIQVSDFYLAGDIYAPYNQYIGFEIVYPCTWSVYDSTGCLENFFRAENAPWDTLYVGINYDNPDPWATVTDTLYATAFEESPWLKKDNKWIRFSEDPLYHLYQKTFIEFLPILKIGDGLSLGENINIENTIKLYPNPAENTLNIESQDIIKEIEFYDALGKKAKTITLNKKDAIIDISSLAKGNYVVNLITDKGKIKKKLVVK
jgi:hypothetical protein